MRESFCRSDPAAAFRGFGVGLLSFAEQTLVQLAEAGERHVHLAAHLEERRRVVAEQP